MLSDGFLHLVGEQEFQTGLRLIFGVVAGDVGIADWAETELEERSGLAFNDFMIHPPSREPGGARRLVAVLLAAIAVVAPAWAQEVAAPGAVSKYDFNTADALAGWTVVGDARIDLTKDRQGAGGSLKIGPGGSALLKLRAEDGSGKVEMWVYDDGSKPEDSKTGRIGPRWGLVQSDGRLMAAGILYASYLAGDEGYTATASNGKDWFEQLFWLGINRAPSGWHKWTFDFDPEAGIRLFHDDKEVGPSLDKANLKGFGALEIWGDNGRENGQTIWVDDVSVVLGGPAHLITVTEADPYDDEAVAKFATSLPPPVIYSRDRAPSTPKLEELPMRESVSEYGITWHFDQPARVGQFVNGDWYVVGPVTVAMIHPAPLYGAEVPLRDLDSIEKERPEEQRVRNGFMVNPPAQMKVAYDSGVKNWWDPSLVQKLPAMLKPGDSLVSTISMPKGLKLHAQLRNIIERGVEDSSPIRTAAVLTCLGAPQPPDAFRPAFCDRGQRIYLARDLKRELLPNAAATRSLPNLDRFIRFTQRPWVGTGFFGFEDPVENMPQYALEYGRVSGLSALLLCADLKPEQKEPLLVNFVQIGIDLGGMIRAGHPGWTGFGGHGSGRKLPIVFAGILLGDDELANINKSFPKASFGEDEQTAYGASWTGATVVFAGHSGIDVATGRGRNRVRREPWGPYEHMPTSQWKDGQKTSESYRRCCTSVGWGGEALALRLLHAEKFWNHDPFFDYVDRWMYENDSEFVKILKASTGRDYGQDWSRQGQFSDPFVNEMWSRHRTELPAPTDGWKQPRDDSYYRAAVANPE